MRCLRHLLRSSGAVLLLWLCSGCDSPEKSGLKAASLAQRHAVLTESPGDYYIGRRYYSSNYKFWGYIRRPGQPWREAKLVMLNENEKLAPDRETNQFGTDDNYEYKLNGRYTGEKVYEPVSNRFLPEFLLTGYELRDRNPPPIFAPGTRQADAAISQPD